MSKLKIALVQMAVTELVEDNLSRARAYVKEAAAAGADFVVLPEMFCCPYDAASFVKNQEPAGGRIWKSLSEMAGENHVYLIGGSMPESVDANVNEYERVSEMGIGSVRDSESEIASKIVSKIEEESVDAIGRGPLQEVEAEPGSLPEEDVSCEDTTSVPCSEMERRTVPRSTTSVPRSQCRRRTVPRFSRSRLYNTCFVFGPDGEQIGRHRKMHLFDIDIKGGQRFCESDTFTGGDEITVVDTAFGKIGVEICFDIRFQELTHLMALQGAKLVFVPAAFNMTTGPVHWDLHFRARAVDSQIFMAGCASARDTKASYVSYGHSLIVSPWGDILQEADEKEGILLQEIDLGLVEEIRDQLPILSARREDVYRLEKA